MIRCIIYFDILNGTLGTLRFIVIKRDGAIRKSMNFVCIMYVYAIKTHKKMQLSPSIRFRVMIVTCDP